MDCKTGSNVAIGEVKSHISLELAKMTSLHEEIGLRGLIFSLFPALVGPPLPRNLRTTSSNYTR